jgi:G3E family GTPase
MPRRLQAAGLAEVVLRHNDQRLKRIVIEKTGIRLAGPVRARPVPAN